MKDSNNENDRSDEWSTPVSSTFGPCKNEAGNDEKDEPRSHVVDIVLPAYWKEETGDSH
jgi:hypothetical protein